MALLAYIRAIHAETLQYARIDIPNGDCWDNGVTETLFGSLKVKRLHDTRFEARRGAMDKIVDWPLFYN